MDREKTAIGLMSGTSADGIEAVLVRLRGCGTKTEYKLLDHRSYPFSDAVRSAIFDLFNPTTGTVDKICHMNFVLGHLFARAALDLINQNGLTRREVDFIGCWGQTVWHQPEPLKIGEVETTATLQLGDITVIAELTGITTVGPFCPRDMAAGGQGSPLTGFGDFIVYRHPKKSRIIVNIGGIANVSLIPCGGQLDDVIGFDTGPGNMVIDALITMLTHGKMRFDVDGQFARKGVVSDQVLRILMEDSFVQKSPPKTTGRERYGVQFATQVLKIARRYRLNKYDIIATATAFTAWAITYNCVTFLLPRITGPVEVIVGGGGAHNPVLVGMLRDQLKPIPVFVDDDIGIIKSSAREALYCALLANETICGNPANVPSVTGAKRWVILGAIAPGETFSELFKEKTWEGRC